MADLLSFYNVLLGIEFAVMGIIAAGLFVFIQLTYANYSYEGISFLFRSWQIIVFSVLGLLSLALTVTGCLVLSIHPHNFVPWIDFGSDNLVRSQWYPLGCIATLIFSASAFGIFVLQNVKFLNPTRIILLAKKKTKLTSIRDFLLREYGIDNPADKMQFEIRITDYKDDIVFDSEQTGIQDLASSIDEELLSLKEKEKQKHYDELVEKIKNAKDPIESLFYFAIQSVLKHDLRTLNEVVNTVQDISFGFIKLYGGIFRGDKSDWDPEKGILLKYGKYISGQFAYISGLCSTTGFETAELVILESCRNIALELINSKNFPAIEELLSFLKETADLSIPHSAESFKRVVKILKELGDKCLDEDIKNEQANSIFRKLGWLGERLFHKKMVEKQPLMHDSEYSNEFDVLIESLLHFGYRYSSKYPNEYPLIYFDALDVTIQRIVKSIQNSDEDTSKLDEWFGSLIYEYYSFGKKAILVGNADGAALSAIRLKQAIDALIEAGKVEKTKDAIRYFWEMGVYAVVNREQMGKTNLIDVIEWIPENLFKMLEYFHSDPRFFDGAVKNVVVHSWEYGPSNSSELVWEYIKSIGKRMGRNFGFMFDSVTGEDYAEDDPRRK